MDSLLIENNNKEFSGVDAQATLNSAYGDMRGLFESQANLFALNEVTSDELLVPTRGTDWGDNGVWRSLHQHTWDPTHTYVLSTWNNLNRNVFKLNQVLDARSNPSAGQTAEAKFLRAVNMYFVLDLFGQIPFREVDEGADVDPRVFDAQASFDFILQDLTDALASGELPATGPSTETLRGSEAAAHFLRAKLFLNKHIFLGTGSAQAADMNEVIASVDAIKGAGFALEDDFFGIFESAVDNETIFWTDASVGQKMWNGLHYHQTVSDNTGGGWNGFSTTAEFYALFEGSSDSNQPDQGQEERRGYVPTDGIGIGFLVGQQYGPEGPLSDRAGRPLVFTKEFEGLVGNGESEGIRVLKYHPSNGAFTNHLIIFRYADAHLMKVEAILRGGSATEDPLSLVNELRELREASALASVSLEDILDERGREMYVEGWRRNDQIRFGEYTSGWDLKESSESFRNLFPIPVTALSTNPNLEQNAGY